MTSAAVGQPQVGERRGVVEAPTGHGGEPLGEPPHRLVVGETYGGRLEPVATVDVDLVGSVDQHVGDAGLPEQRLERAGAEHVATQRFVDGEHGGVTDRTARCPQRLGHPMWGEVAGPVGEPLADAVDDLGLDLGDAHAASAAGVEAGEQLTGRGGERSATRPDRTQPEVEGLGQPALVGHGRDHRGADERGHPSRVGAATTDQQPDPARVGQRGHPPGRGGDTGDRRHDDEHDQRAPRDRLGHEVARAREVDDHGVVAAARRRQGLADRAGVEGRRRGGPPQHAQPVAARHRLSQGAPAQPAGRRAERVPPHARRVVEGEHPVAPGPQRVEVDDQRRPPGRRHLTQPAGQRRRPGATGTADDADQDALAAADLLEVGEQLGDQLGADGQLDDPLGADEQRVTERPRRHG